MSNLFRVAVLVAFASYLGIPAGVTSAATTKPAAAPKATASPKSTAAAKPTAAQLEALNAVNANRIRVKASPVKLNSALNTAAQKFAEYMAKTGKFSHTADGKAPWTRMSEAGYRWSAAGEIIAAGYGSWTSAINNGWMNSTGHRNILLSKSYSDIGVGHAGRYWVIDFGRPR